MKFHDGVLSPGDYTRDASIDVDHDKEWEKERAQCWVHDVSCITVVVTVVFHIPVLFVPVENKWKNFMIHVW